LTNSLPQIIVTQLGARMHYAVPALLHRAGMLGHFYTDAYVGAGSSWHYLAQLARLIPSSWHPAALRRLLNRREDELPGEKVTAFNLLGYRYARALQKTGDPNELFAIHKKFGDLFCREVLRRNGCRGDAIWAFQGAALPLFEKAKPWGLKCFYEQFIAPEAIMHPLLQEEHDLWPEWEGSYPADSRLHQEVGKIEEQVWSLADLVTCASEFVRQGLVSQGVAPEKIRVVPYGVKVSNYGAPRQPWDGRRPLRLLFVGGVTVRKGVQYLSEALSRLHSSKIEARVVGPVSLSPAAQAQVRRVAELTGQVPRHEVRRHYAWADLFVFPSICEGSATVCYEALASGLPVITTPNAGSVVRDGVDGFIVPIRDAVALAEKIALLSHDVAVIKEMSQNAVKRARYFSWEQYNKRLIDNIIRFVLRSKHGLPFYAIKNNRMYWEEDE
jgi:glycosyltransferase involved in cell wall biosynthesis